MVLDSPRSFFVVYGYAVVILTRIYLIEGSLILEHVHAEVIGKTRITTSLNVLVMTY